MGYFSPELDLVYKIINEGKLAGPYVGEFMSAARAVGGRLATQWGQMAASTAPVWRQIRVINPGAGRVVEPWNRIGFAGRGTSAVASLEGLAALGIAGVCIVVAVGVYVALGAGIYEARKRVQQRGFMTGFSRGFVTGMLNWEWPIVWDRFRVRVAYMNAADPNAGRIEAAAENEGLFIGFCLALPAAEATKKNFRKALRALAGRTDDAAWSRDRDVARNQQIDYVVALAAAGVNKGLIKAD